MEIFVKALQSSYAYLLIFQILVVASLFLLMLVLIVRRIRESAVANFKEAVVEVAQVQPNLPMAAAATPTIENTREIEASKPLSVPSEETGELEEKVKFLESKLLEYEILQEEIGTLSTLKLENEQLKQHVVLLQSAEEKRQPASVAEPRVENGRKFTEAVGPTTLADEEHSSVAEAFLSSQSLKEPSSQPDTEESIDTKTAPLAITFDAEPSGGPDTKELESLLRQIDELTKAGPETLI